MSVLVVYSSSQNGYDPVVPSLCNFFDGVPLNVDFFDASVLEKSYDMVLIIDCVDWYMGNRLKLQGRPWICLAAFQFATLTTFLVNNVPDSGIDFFISNCKTFIDQVSNTLPALFSYKPVVRRKLFGSDRQLIGTILSNVEDRDFSMLARAYAQISRVTDAAKRFAIFLPDTNKMALPAVFKSANVVVYDSDNLYWHHASTLRAAVLTPRVTDYRSGILPPELISWQEMGIEVTGIHHQAISRLDQLMNMPRTLTDFDTHIDEILNGSDSFTSQLPPELRPSVADFGKLILDAKHAAA